MWWDKNYPSRAMLAFDNWAGDATPFDGSVTIPPELDTFWAAVRSDGQDVRFFQADGRTAIPFKRTTWTPASRAGLFELSQVPAKTGTVLAWMYWGYTAAGEGATTPTIASPKAGALWIGALDRQALVRVRPALSVASLPTIVRSSVEERRIFWDFRDQLLPSSTAIAGRRAWEELAVVTGIQVLDADEVAQAAMVATGKTRVADGVVSTWIKGGDAGADYIARVQVETTLSRVIEGRCRVRIRDVEV